MNEGGVLGTVEQAFSIDRQGGPYAQAFSGPVVDLIGNGVELLLAVAREIGALGQVLAHQPVGVLVGATLPRAVRVTEVHREARAPAQLLVHGHLAPLVLRHALAHGHSDTQQLVREGLHHVGCAGGFELG
jgi:hypothetical protein